MKPGGTIGILEFAEPPAGLFGDFYRWYFRKILPKVGGAISGDAAAYKYLPSSVARFFRPGELCDLMRAAGLKSVEAAVWTGGTVALHTGVKAGTIVSIPPTSTTVPFPVLSRLYLFRSF